MKRSPNGSADRLSTTLLHTPIPTQVYNKILLIARGRGESPKTVVTDLLKRGLETRAEELNGDLQKQLTRL